MSEQSTPFLKGWRALPEELKLHILGLVLAPEPSKQTRGLLCYHHLKEARFWNQYPFQGLTLPLLGCGEIKHLVLQAFYTQHSFFLDYSAVEYSIIFGVEYVCFPPQHVAKFIRRLNIRFSLLSAQRLQILEWIASGTERLQNLVSVDIYLPSPLYTWHSRDACNDKAEYVAYLESMDEVYFEARCLRIAYEDWDKKDLDPPLLEKLTLHPLMGPSKTTWTRLRSVYDDTGTQQRLEEVDTWGTAAPLWHKSRWTVMEVITEEKYRLRPFTSYDRQHDLV